MFLETLRTLMVIETTPMLIAQDMVSFSNEFEGFFGYRVFRVAVGVIPECKLPKALLNILERCILREVKNPVIVAIGLHALPAE
jgi:hypothetical protein